MRIKQTKKARRRTFEATPKIVEHGLKFDTMTCEPSCKNTHSVNELETKDEISCIPVTNGTTYTESNTALNDKPAVERGIGEVLLY